MTIGDMNFADDIYLLDDYGVDAQSLQDKLAGKAVLVRLHLNADKTEIYTQDFH